MEITSAQEQIIIIYFYNIITIVIIIIITSAGADGDDALGGREGHGGVSEGMEYPEYPLQYPWSYRYTWSTLRVL
jgi:hypothetical protein